MKLRGVTKIVDANTEIFEMYGDRQERQRHEDDGDHLYPEAMNKTEFKGIHGDAGIFPVLHMRHIHTDRNLEIGIFLYQSDLYLPFARHRQNREGWAIATPMVFPSISSLMSTDQCKAPPVEIHRVSLLATVEGASSTHLRGQEVQRRHSSALRL